MSFVRSNSATGIARLDDGAAREDFGENQAVARIHNLRNHHRYGIHWLHRAGCANVPGDLAAGDRRDRSGQRVARTEAGGCQEPLPNFEHEAGFGAWR